MRSRSAIERLSDAGRPLLAGADALADKGEQEQILERILASDRARDRRRWPVAVVLVAAAVAGAAVAVVVTHRHATSVRPPARSRFALTGARIQMAGYRFRTPAGFKHETAQDTSCNGPGPNPTVNGFAAAASADGGCVAVYFSAGRYGPPSDATAVTVASYDSYFVPSNASGQSVLYVTLPEGTGDGRPVYLALFARDLTEDQLIAVAESGLSDIPFTPTTTTGTEAS